MATVSRVGIGGWRQSVDTATVSRVGIGGWYQIISSAAPLRRRNRLMMLVY